MMKQRSLYHSYLWLMIVLLIASFSDRHLFVSGEAAIVVSMGGEELQIPAHHSSSGGVLDIDLSIRYGNYSIVDPNQENATVFSMTNTRLFDGLLPGKTLYVSPGDTMRIHYTNELEYQPNANNAGLNIMGYPDHSNLHFHGAHVSGELPSDDIRMKVAPNASYQYETTFPDNHMGGTGWVHPHIHGSSALQVGGGAVGALIVRDDNTALPSFIANAPDVLLVVQDINVAESQFVIRKSRDEKLQYYRDTASSIPNSFRLINGQYQPYYTMIPAEWVRFRVIYGGWLADPLDLAFPGCDVALLAKDGVYIRDFPRTIAAYLPIPTGGRADVMVRCTTPDTVHPVTDYAGQTVFELRVLSASVDTVPEPSVLSAWTPEYPAYLENLCAATVTPGCSCETGMRDCPADIVVANSFDEEHKCINGEIFDPDRYIHSIPFGATVERFLLGNRIHPYHQHVHPFQLCNQYASEAAATMSDQNKEYFQINDWHDVWSSKTGDSAIGQQVRFRPNVHYGRLMIHCHVLSHEDQGTMSQEYVSDDAECDCTPRPGRVGDSGNQDCFSSIATAHVYNKGRVPMQDLLVGDKVLTATGEYQTLYSMNHYHPTKETVFVQIKTDLLSSSSSSSSSEEEEPLELSPNHLLFVIRETNVTADTTTTTATTTAYPVPASSIEIGNKVQTIAGESTVIEINIITRHGLYNPLTTDGTIIVNGIVASTYTSPNGRSHIEINKENRPHAANDNETKTNTHSLLLLSFHDALHMMSAPYRQLCLTVSLDVCNLHGEKSMPSVVIESIFHLWNFQQNYYVKHIIYSLYVLFFTLIETISVTVSSNTTIHIIGKCVAVLGSVMYYYYSSSYFSRQKFRNTNFSYQQSN